VENSTGYPHGSLDGKTTNRTMTLNHETWARYGHSCGEDFIASDHAAKNPDYAFSNLKDMIAQPWTTFGFLEPITILVVDKNGDPVENSQIAFENCADGYLAEGTTDGNGMYHHPYFQTGTYNITAKNGKYRGSLWVEFDEVNTLEIQLTEDTTQDDMSSKGQTTVMIIGLVMVGVMLVVLAHKKYKKKNE
jgi:hypothetical protein